jgi:NTP pyrophosphatase (non-canonical NTP hydrolase)
MIPKVPLKKQVSTMSYKRWTLLEWSAMFKEVYELRNLSLSPGQTLHRLIEETAELVKPILLYDMKEIKWCLPDIVAWLCAFVNIYKIDLQEIMVGRYIKNPPGKLGRTASPVEVLGQGIEQPETFDDWQVYLGFIYRDENANIPPELMVSKLIEDVGMTSRNLRTHQDISIVKKSLAGVLAWTIALANKFQIGIDNIVYKKYPNYCFRCRSRPCKCFQLSTIFISYTTDTHEEMLRVKDLIENDLKLEVEVFEKLGPAFHRMRMIEAFNAINRSNGAVVLLKDRWSENVWAELIEILKVTDENNVWICVQNNKKKKRGKLKFMLEDVKHFHRIDYYSETPQLLRFLKKEIDGRIEDLQKLKKKSSS